MVSQPAPQANTIGKLQPQHLANIFSHVDKQPPARMRAGMVKVDGIIDLDSRVAIRTLGSVSVWSCSGEFTSPRGGVKPPLRQTETLPNAEQQLNHPRGASPVELERAGASSWPSQRPLPVRCISIRTNSPLPLAARTIDLFRRKRTGKISSSRRRGARIKRGE